MAGGGVALDAEERGGRAADEADQRVEVGRVEDLLGVALDVGGGEDGAVALALAPLGVGLVLGFAHRGGRGQFGQVLVDDPGLAQRRFQPLRVRPGVLRAAHAAPLAHVEQQVDARLAQRRQEAVEVGAVDADREDLFQASSRSRAPA